MHLGIIANHAKPGAAGVLARVAQAAERLGIHLHADAATLASLGCGSLCPTERLGLETTAVLVLGGDGSMLHASRLLDGQDVPLAGINTGTLGYMTCASAGQVERVMECLVKGEVCIEERTRIETRRIGGAEAEFPSKYALNDVVISRGESGRVVSLEVRVDERPVTTYVCDGLIVATPTGSTAYSLAAGGPILSTDTPALVISVICPHTLSSRPLVLPDTSSIQICIQRAAAPMLWSVDGQEDEPLQVGDRVLVRRATRVARIVMLKDHDAFAVLRRKLGWSGSAV